MAFNSTNPVAVGAKTRKSHYDRAFDNTNALREARHSHNLGGDVNSVVDDTSFVPIPEAITIEIDGTNLAGLTVDVHCMALVDGGTGTIRLRNTTDSTTMGSQTFTNTTAALVKITGITLTTGTKSYRLEVQGSAGSTLPCVYGARLVLR